MNYQQSEKGKLAYDLDTDLLVCVIREFDRPADEVFVNLDKLPIAYYFRPEFFLVSSISEQ